jgi:hypothetical protein
MSVATNPHSRPDVRSLEHLLVAQLAVMALLASGCVSVGQRHPKFNALAPSVRTVAIVPFGYATEDRDGAIDTASAVRVAESVRRSTALHLLQRQQGGALTVTLQSVEETDGRIVDAGLSPAATVDMSAGELAAVLGVDAVLRGNITAYDVPDAATEVARGAASLLVGGLVGRLIAPKGGKLSCTFALHDARSGTRMWSLDQTFRAGAFKSPDAMLAQSGSAMANHFPFHR